MTGGRLASVNVVHAVKDLPGGRGRRTAIDKRPVDHPVPVGTLGLTGDTQVNRKHHGGPDKAVYAYAVEDLEEWSRALGRPLPAGAFGENLTTRGVDVTGAMVGERWRVGADVLLEVTMPRTPCDTFTVHMQERGWVRRFTEGGAPGAYLRVLVPGDVRTGDPVTVVDRPRHGVTVGHVFRPRTADADALRRLVDAPGVAEPVLRAVRKALAPAGR